MLAIGRALMQEPRFLISDEPSLGLAPVLSRISFGSSKTSTTAADHSPGGGENVSQTLQLVDYATLWKTAGSSWRPGPGSGRQPKVKEAYLGFLILPHKRILSFESSFPV